MLYIELHIVMIVVSYGKIKEQPVKTPIIMQRKPDMRF